MILHVHLAMGGGWAVRAHRVWRARKILETKLAALNYARRMTGAEGIYVHRADGTVERIETIPLEQRT